MFSRLFIDLLELYKKYYNYISMRLADESLMCRSAFKKTLYTIDEIIRCIWINKIFIDYYDDCIIYYF